MAASQIQTPHGSISTAWKSTDLDFDCEMNELDNVQGKELLL